MNKNSVTNAVSKFEASVYVTDLDIDKNTAFIMYCTQRLADVRGRVDKERTKQSGYGLLEISTEIKELEALVTGVFGTKKVSIT